MGKVMVVGCGGVAGVAIHKICQNSDVFSELCPPCDPTGASTAAACKIVREMLIALAGQRQNI